MTLDERQKIDRLRELFAKSKALDKERAQYLVIIIDTLIEECAHGNTQSVEHGLVVLRRILANEAEA